MDTCKLAATTGYNTRYAPEGAKKAYVAKITGRTDSAVKYKRKFLGNEVTLVEGDQGLYERQCVDKKGRPTRYYHVVLWDDENRRMICSKDCEGLVPQIAARLDNGEAIGDIVDATDVVDRSESGKCHQFVAVLRAAPRKVKPATTSAAPKDVAALRDAIIALEDE